MATRSTKAKAEELKAQLEERYPKSEFRILENTQQSRWIGRGIAEREGYEILEDDGSPIILANCTEFAVVEVRKCYSCGAEILTHAIGEMGNDECSACHEARIARQEAARARSIESGNESVARWAARDCWEEK